VPMTDGTYESEQALSKMHRMIRRLIYAKASGFVYASLGGKKLYESYGVMPERCFQSHLCIDNDAFAPTDIPQPKQYDLVFCGRMESEKSPLFTVDVAAEAAKKMGRKIKILFVGSGSQLDHVRQAVCARSDLLEAHFHGFAAQEELPDLYRSASIFLFPTVAGVWGVVANEACAAGLPVLVTPHAGVAGELVLDGQNGFVSELNVGVWAEHVIRLLTQPALLQQFSRRSLSLVRHYNFDAAADGLANACRYAFKPRLALVQA
jgi:glycosyltransferase involved in cell wall biosynthesis